MATRQDIQNHITANWTAPQSDIQVAKTIYELLLNNSLNLDTDAALLGLSPYDPTKSYDAGKTVTYNDGTNKLYQANKTTTGTFAPADWDEVGGGSANLLQNNTIFVNAVNGSDTNGGRSVNTAVQTIDKAIDIHNASGQSNTVLLMPGSYTQVGAKTINTGLTIAGLGTPFLAYKQNTANATGGTFSFRVNGCELSASGLSILSLNGAGASATTFDLDLRYNTWAWTQQAENNGTVAILDSATVHTVNCDISFGKGSDFVLHTDKATATLTANNCEGLEVVNQTAHTGAATLTTNCYDSRIDSSSRLISSTSSGAGTQTITGSVNLGGVTSKSIGFSRIIAESVASGNGVYTINTTAASSFLGNTQASIIYNATTPTYNGPGSILCSDGYLFNPFANASHGFIDYNDSTTATTPITLVANTWTDITNDGAGAFTNKTYKPTNVTELLDTSTGYLDVSELPLGSDIIIRKDFTVTPNTNNTGIKFRYVLGTGAGEYTLETDLPRLDNGAGIGYRFSLGTDYIYMGDANTRDNPIKLQIKVDSDSTLVNAGIVIKVTK